MTFEEFFKKKKISLAALQQAEGGLFAEFKTHYDAMGEKSFDHTKKYWFNKLRRLYPLPPEVKVEKVVIENQLAEQTITETLTAPTIADEPKVGFKPRFKAGAMANKPAEPTNTPPTKIPEQPQEDPVTDKPAQTVKPGFTPRFKAGVTPKKTEEVKQPEEPKQAGPEAGPANADDAPAPKPGFKP